MTETEKMKDFLLIFSRFLTGGWNRNARQEVPPTFRRQDGTQASAADDKSKPQGRGFDLKFK
jgi:hypothetical protein